MDNDTQQATQILSQGEFDPRHRMRDKSALEEDSADVFCILYSRSEFTYPTMKHTARTKPEHMLFNKGMISFDGGAATDSIINLGNGLATGIEQGIGLRFSADVVDPVSGFVFGRSETDCDVNLDPEGVHPRMSKKHFRIYINKDGILMLADSSSNGTIVDGQLVGGTNWKNAYPKTRMLRHASNIEILCDFEAKIVIAFSVVIPRRYCDESKYMANFQNYLQFQALAAECKEKGLPIPRGKDREMLATQNARFSESRSTLNHFPSGTNGNYGMIWNGGADFTCIGVVGKGAFATVYQIATTWSGQIYAAKELEKKRFMKNGVLDERLSNELKIMKGLQHPHIVDYVDYHDVNTHLYIIMEYVRFGDLQTYMHPKNEDPRTLPESLAKQMTKQILHALAYLHGKDITHRDIKPDNILIASEEPFVVKLTDFGLSKMANDDDTFLKTFCGTLLYCAPEVFPYFVDSGPPKSRKRRRTDGRRSYSQSVDIWSYAAVLWYVLCGKPAFEGITDGNGRAMYERIMHTDLDINPLLEHGVSDSCIDLLFEMLDVDPNSRPSELDCLTHPWLLEDDLITQNLLPQGLPAIDEEDEGAGRSRLDLGDQAGSSGSYDREVKRHKGDTFYATREIADMQSSTEGSISFTPVLQDFQSNAQSGNFPDLPTQGGHQDVLRQGPLILRNTNVFGTPVVFEPLESPLVDYEPSTYNGDTIAAQEGDFSYPTSSQSIELDPTDGNRATSRVEPVNPQLPVLGRNQHYKLEAMVADLQMESPEPINTNAAEEDVQMAATRDGHQPESTTGRKGAGESDETSEQAAPKRTAFSRRITLPVPPSFYYDPHDPSTHNEEYAARAARMASQSHTLAESAAPNTAPTTLGTTGMTSMTSSTTSQFSPNKENEQLSQPLSIPSFPLPLPSAFAKAPPLYGKLTSTPSSFTALTLPLTQRHTTWGRNRHNTLVYHDSLDTRVAKDALELWFHAPGVEELERAGGDWTSLAGNLHVIVGTKSSKGIFVNGVRLPDRDARGRKCYGRLYTGDEVCVSSSVEGEELRFVCEFFVGRSERVRGGGWARFVVEVAED